MAAHAVAVTYKGGRYPHLPTCSCGWSTTWGYLTDFAAQVVADDHKGGCDCHEYELPDRA